MWGRERQIDRETERQRERKIGGEEDISKGRNQLIETKMVTNRSISSHGQTDQTDSITLANKNCSILWQMSHPIPPESLFWGYSVFGPFRIYFWFSHFCSVNKSLHRPGFICAHKA